MASNHHLLSQSKSSFKHASFYKKVRSALTRTNQQVGINFVSDSKNKAKDAKTFASSTLQGFTAEKKEGTGPIQYFNNCLLQFPIVSSKIQKLEILLDIPRENKIEFKLHQGSSNYSINRIEFRSLLPMKTDGALRRVFLKQ